MHLLVQNLVETAHFQTSRVGYPPGFDVPDDCTFCTQLDQDEPESGPALRPQDLALESSRELLIDPRSLGLRARAHGLGPASTCSVQLLCVLKI